MKKIPTLTLIAGAVAVLVLMGGIFWLLMSHAQQADNPYADTKSGGQSIPQGSIGDSAGASGSPSNQQMQGGHPPVTGTVTNVSSTSITIKTSDGSKHTYTITSNTEMLAGPNQGGTVYDASQIQIGEQVGIAVNADDTTEAQVVLLNYNTYTN